MMVMELVAVVLALAGDSPSANPVFRLLLLSIYLQAMGLCGGAVLCVARRWLRVAHVSIVFLVCWALLVGVIYSISEVAWAVFATFDFGIRLHSTHNEFLLRNTVIGAIVGLLLLRYFWDRYHWQEETRAESEARYLALQARIRPHFLFNALTSLAELIRSRPDKAESMVEDLADLFRASLESNGRLIPLREEIETVRGYLRIEEVRLGDKLMVNWEIPDELLDALVPRLIVQPLAENAVIHGIARLRARGLLHITAQRQLGKLMVDVENPLPPEDAPRRKGTGVAVTNIQQRIKLIYGSRAELDLRAGRDEYGGMFRARLLVPLDFGDHALEDDVFGAEPQPQIAEESESA